MRNAKHQSDHAEQRFGTFGGVFTPCTLTILGVIMFLRFGHVVGQAGIVEALAIIAAAKIITVVTTLSLSAIATNTRVRGGGAYYLISRSLGHEFGGSFGSVDRWPIFVTPIVPNELWRTEKLGYSYGYRDNFPELTLADIARPELAKWMLEVWSVLPTLTREKIVSLIENSLAEISAPATDLESVSCLL